MTEAYIHFIWKLKRLPFHQLKTTEGKEIQILNNGIHNISESGPDFFNARMIYDNMEWAGQIEIHVKSSDWYLHQHHKDEAYNNVMLHVVYEHDKEVFTNAVKLPTIELKNYIDEAHFQRWQTFSNAMKEIPCEDSIKEIDAVFLKAMIHRAVNDRMNRKINQLMYLYDSMDNQSVLYNLIARAFGTKVNALPFELLTNQLPLSILKRLNRTTQQKVLLQTSGLFENIFLHSLNIPVSTQPISSVIWKRKGLRPTSFPEKRVMQFAAFVTACDFELLAENLSPKEALTYISELMCKGDGSMMASEQLINQLLINALLPYFWFKSLRDENDSLQEYVLSFMEEIPPEDNFILKKWKKIGVNAQNAYESQALIELYNEYCTHKKCLQCQIGVKILRGE